jgi:hypothetical protein
MRPHTLLARLAGQHGRAAPNQLLGCFLQPGDGVRCRGELHEPRGRRQTARGAVLLGARQTLELRPETARLIENQASHCLRRIAARTGERERSDDSSVAVAIAGRRTCWKLDAGVREMGTLSASAASLSPKRLMLEAKSSCEEVRRCQEIPRSGSIR